MQLLMSQCAKQVKRISLELGGLCPFIIFDSADLSKVISGTLHSKFGNCGQKCISPQFFFIQKGE